MSAPDSRSPLLRVKDLHVEFATYGGIVQAVREALACDVTGQYLLRAQLLLNKLTAAIQ